MTAAIRIPLLDGFVQEGRRHWTADLRPLSGVDEEALFGAASDALPAERSTAVLAAVTTAIGSVDRPGAAAIRCLSLGDRERLLLGLFAVTFAPRAALLARCGYDDCGETIEVPIDFGVVLAASAPARGAPPALDAATERGPVRIELRHPDGSDLEAASRLARDDVEGAGEMLLGRCIARAVDPSGREVAPADLPRSTRAEIERLLSAHDPALEAATHLPCPHCGLEVEVVLDAFKMLESEIGEGEPLLAQVHRLARAYHWSERDILALPTGRRRRYLSLVDTMGPPS